MDQSSLSPINGNSGASAIIEPQNPPAADTAALVNDATQEAFISLSSDQGSPGLPGKPPLPPLKEENRVKKVNIEKEKNPGLPIIPAEKSNPDIPEISHVPTSHENHPVPPLPIQSEIEENAGRQEKKNIAKSKESFHTFMKSTSAVTLLAIGFFASLLAFTGLFAGTWIISGVSLMVAAGGFTGGSILMHQIFSKKPAI